MRTALAVIGLFVAFPVRGQSLDLGGVEITLGADADSTHRLLASKFLIETDSGRRGSNPNQYQLVALPRGPGSTLGWVEVRAHRVVTITKLYRDFDYANDFRRMFSAGIQEIHTRGGEECTTRFPPVDATATSVNRYDLATGEWTTVPGSLIAGIETDCGRYRLVVLFPAGTTGILGLYLRLTSDSP